jgi:hypothetical protein
VPLTVLVSPAWIDDTTASFAESTGEDFDSLGVARSRELAAEVRRVAEERGVLFADAAEVAHVGADGLHLGPDSHARLAELVASRLTT